MLSEQEEIAKIRIPKQGEILGLAISMVGGSKIVVECSDGKTRLCRIPGKIRKKIWIRVGDVVLVTPWVVQSDERGDIVWRYTKTQANWLKRKGYTKNLNIE